MFTIEECLHQLEKIVVTEGCDEGVVLLDQHGPCHTEDWNGKSISVYNHKYFSPLGDALILLHRMLQEIQKVNEKPIEYDFVYLDEIDGEPRRIRKWGQSYWRFYWHKHNKGWVSQDFFVRQESLIKEYYDQRLPNDQAKLYEGGVPFKNSVQPINI